MSRVERFREANPGWDLARMIAYPPVPVEVQTIEWHPGYDGYRWAL